MRVSAFQTKQHREQRRTVIFSVPYPGEHFCKRHFLAHLLRWLSRISNVNVKLIGSAIVHACRTGEHLKVFFFSLAYRFRSLAVRSNQHVNVRGQGILELILKIFSLSSFFWRLNQPAVSDLGGIFGR